MKTIFAVDDSPTARASIEYALKKAGFRVVLKEDGPSALESLQANPEEVAVFILDINMPKMDGLTLIRKIRELESYKFTPILFLTTESQESMKMEGKKAGASGWIVKPFEPETLVSLIERFAGV